MHGHQRLQYFWGGAKFVSTDKIGSFVGYSIETTQVVVNNPNPSRATNLTPTSVCTMRYE
jgi:hypothetical protein